MTVRRFGTLLIRNGLIGIALVATTALSTVTTMRRLVGAQEVVVPTLVGQSLGAAGSAAAQAGLLLRVEGRRHDARAPLDAVVAQEPPAGSSLKSRRTVRLWVSLGPRRLTVPAVEGESVRTGRITLEQSEVGVARVVEVDDRADEGTILVQRPAAGDTEQAADGVSLLVSRGPLVRDYLMPDLIGRPATSALDALRRTGLKAADVRYRFYAGVAPGIVLRQWPAAGYKVNPRTAVALDVSKAAS